MRVNTVLTSLLLLLGVGLTVDAHAQSEKKGSSNGADSSTKKGEPSSSSTKSSSTKSSGAKGSGAKDSGGGGSASSKYTSVKMGKVEEFKPFWRSVKSIQDSITGFETQLTATRNGLKDAAGVARDRPLKTAFDGMKKQAGGKLSVTQTGGVPKLSGDGLPENVANFVNAANEAVMSCLSIVEGAKGFPKQLGELFTEVQALPGRLDSNLLAKNNLSSDDLGGQLTVIANNAEAVAQTKDRVQAVVASAQKIVGFVAELAPQKP